MAENIIDGDGKLWKSRQNKHEFGVMHPVRNVRSGIFCLLDEVIKRTWDDKKCYDEGRPPVGNSGYARNKDGKEYKKNLLKVDPIQELLESAIYDIINQYYINKHRGDNYGNIHIGADFKSKANVQKVFHTVG